MKRPLTGLVVMFAAGILVGSWFDCPLGWLCIAAVVSVSLFFCFRRAELLWLALVCAGLWAYRFSTTNFEPNHISHLLPYREQNVFLRGVIIDDPGYRDAEEEGQRHSFKLRLEALKRAADWEPAGGTVLVFVSASREQSPLRYGDEIEFSAGLRVPPPASNPGVFDWRRWLALKNIQFAATIRKLDDCKTLSVNRGNWFLAVSQRLREHFERVLRIGFEDQPHLAGILTGLVIGERSDIPEDTYADFQQTGVFHVFAINGLHVGLVAAIVVMTLRLVRVPRRWTALPAIPLLIFYVCATGAHPGAVRALVMVCVWLIGGLLIRPVDSLSGLALAAFVILLWQPSQLFDGGFLLSFVVVWSLIVLTDRSSLWKFMLSPEPAAATRESRWFKLLRPDPYLPRLLVPAWRRWQVRWTNAILILASGSLAAWIGLLPLLAIYFHLFTPISILANICVIPLLGCILAVGLAGAIVFPVCPAATLTLNNANFFLLHLLIGWVDWLSRFEWGHWFVHAPPVWLTVGYYALLVIWAGSGLKLRWLALPVALFLIVMVWPDNSAAITVLDLRDGTAVFVNLPGEKDDWLIDGGSDWGGAHVVLPYLRGQGVDRLAAVALTRNDKGHAAGLTKIAQEVPVRQAIHTATGSRSNFFWEWLAAMRQRGAEIISLRAGDERQAGKLKIHVLHPPVKGTATRSDDNSLVLLLEYGPTRVLLASDIGESVEKELAATGNLQAQVLIKGRHGAEPSGTEAFLDAVRPAVVIQSVGRQFGDWEYRSDLPERLRSRGTKFYRTDETGAVTVHLTEAGYAIQTCFESTGAAR